MPKQRIVITGLGVISPFGDGINPFWDAVSTGKNGIGPVTLFDATELNCRVAAECKEFDATKYMDPKEAKRSDRYTHFAVAAAKLALKDANIKEGDVDPERFGVLIGSGVGGMDTIEKQSRAFIERGPRRVSPFMIPNLLANMSSGVVAIDVGAKGVNFSVVSACATGTHAIGEALLHLQMGREDVILAGGSEAAVTPLSFAGFCAMKAMATNFNDEPQRASRPFDADRCGFIDNNGDIIPMDLFTALIAQDILADGKATILYDLRSSWAVKECIEENGGVAVMSRVGHAFIKNQMRELNAVFAGELSGHYYFKENFTAESQGLAMIKLANLIESSGKKVSELVAPLRRYAFSGEINSKVADTKKVFEKIREKYADGKIVELDGISVDYPEWHFNVRASNTEPVIRLICEAKCQKLMEEKRDELLALIRG